MTANFGSCFGGDPIQLRAPSLLTTLKMGIGQRFADYFTKVMRLFKDINFIVPDELKKTLLAKGLPKDLKDVVFFSEVVDT